MRKDVFVFRSFKQIEMLTLLTACGRNDLLEKTMQSLKGYALEKAMYFILTEDSQQSILQGEISDICKNVSGCYVTFYNTKSIGQHKAIEFFFSLNYNEKYYLHIEDDWSFNNSYDWIAASIAIMEKDPMIIKVLARFESPHPCEHTEYVRDGLSYGYLKPWTSPDGTEWCGFSWNPGVTRLDLLKQFTPLPKWEQELAQQIYDSGYKVVELSIPVYTHIGDGRSTHQ